MNKLIKKTMLKFLQGGTFKDAFNNARNQKNKFFIYNGKIYTSEDKNDKLYNSFNNNLAEVEASLNPKDKLLGWGK